MTEQTTFIMDSRIYMVVLTVILIAIPCSGGFRSDFSAIPFHTVAQDGRTTWHHDCSNTTGFTRVDEWNTGTPITYGEMKSNGDYLWFDNVTNIAGPHGPVFVHEFNESFQLVALEEFVTTLGMYCSDGHDRGGINIYLMDEMFSPVLVTFSADSDNSSYFDIKGSFGNVFYPFKESNSGQSISYIRSSMSEVVTFSFTMGDDEIISSMSGYGSSNLYADLGINNGRFIKYLVIEYREYDQGDFNDWGFHIFDMSLTYNTHTVEIDEILNLYYSIPQTYLWDGVEIYPSTGISSHALNENETNLYYAIVTAGTWNITTTHEEWLDLRIDVIVNGTALVSGVGPGDFPTIEFTVEETTYILINVTENSLSGDSFGYYDMVLSQIAVITTTTDSSTTTDTGNGIVLPDLSEMGIPLAALSLLFGVILFTILMKRKNESLLPSETFEISIQDIPRQYQHVPEAKETIRTIRLPMICPHCGGAVIQEEIDWTGPLQAKCNYCGGAIRATFESV